MTGYNNGSFTDSDLLLRVFDRTPVGLRSELSVALGLEQAEKSTAV